MVFLDTTHIVTVMWGLFGHSGIVDVAGLGRSGGLVDLGVMGRGSMHVGVDEVAQESWHSSLTWSYQPHQAMKSDTMYMLLTSGFSGGGSDRLGLKDLRPGVVELVGCQEIFLTTKRLEIM